MSSRKPRVRPHVIGPVIISPKVATRVREVCEVTGLTLRDAVEAALRQWLTSLAPAFDAWSHLEPFDPLRGEEPNYCRACGAPEHTGECAEETSE